ncbi:hypothetical protein, partial [Roseinatronobacter sp.]|uniref:hypothetical protein n=1 Tax=Roseinatronobacter sp. TaxID=1945755 RepID=UPI0025E164BA
ALHRARISAAVRRRNEKGFRLMKKTPALRWRFCAYSGQNCKKDFIFTEISRAHTNRGRVIGPIT